MHIEYSATISRERERDRVIPRGIAQTNDLPSSSIAPAVAIQALLDAKRALVLVLLGLLPNFRRRTRVPDLVPQFAEFRFGEPFNGVVVYDQTEEPLSL
ncbi:hypothetical protein NL676_006340 [Syzygium grande]|nr:hypothetical protein NL676_006340 [Syzygium grande]